MHKFIPLCEMNMEKEMKYSERIAHVEGLIKKLQSCNDVDDAISMYTSAVEHLNVCEQKLQSAKGSFEEISSQSTRPDAPASMTTP